MIDAPDRRPTLYVVAVSHLDSQWRWTLRETVARFLPRTVEENRAAFARHPRYVLNFEGAHRYALLREHHPAAWEDVKRWVGTGRWAPVGATWEAMDCILPAPESLLRQIHLGQRFFERHLGRRSHDLFLPDCFGFPAALPTVAAHAGLIGFSTQKLRLREALRAAAPIPFGFGRWAGPDGSELLAALDPGGYGEPVTVDLSRDAGWIRRLRELSAAGQPPVAVLYTGIGDKGGALPDATLSRLEEAAGTEGEVAVVPCESSRPFLSLTPGERARLPRHQGELLLAVHATGGYTSQAAIKRGNRDGERLAAAAECAAALAATHTAFAYPAPTLRWAWKRLLAHQMHDTLCGTCIPAANAIAWNDQALAQSRFAQAMAHALAALARDLDTRTTGSPMAVFNPLGLEVEEVVEVAFPPGARLPAHALARDARGHATPVQWSRASGGTTRALFLARLAPLSLAVFSLEPAAGPPADSDDLAVDLTRMTSRHLRLEIDGAGDVASVRTRDTGREQLAAPFGFELLRDVSKRFPAWEVMHDDLAAPACGRFAAPARVAVCESGPVRVALAIERRAARSSLRLVVRLAAGEAGRRVEFDLELDWRSRARLLKARLETATPDSRALYDGGLGVVEREVSSPRLYEVPAQAWAVLEGSDGAGTAILTPHTSGLDHPSPGVLRPTLVRTPGLGHRFTYQRDQDLGRHRLRLALLPYAGGWREGAVVEQAERLRQPPIGFPVSAHAGPLGRSVTLGEVAGRGLWLNAVKGLEDSDGLLFRLRETRGEAARATVRLARSPAAAWLTDGCERPIAPAELAANRIDLDLPAWGLASLRLDLLPRDAPREVATRPLPWPADRVVSSYDGERGGAGFDHRGRHFPAEQVPARFEIDGVTFVPAFDAAGHLLAARPDGQVLELDGACGDLYLLAGSGRGERRVEVTIDEVAMALPVHPWRGAFAGWDRTLRVGRLPFALRRPAFRRSAHVAWVAGHLHDRAGGNLAAEPGLLYRYRLELPARPCRVVLGRDRAVLVVAASLGPRWLVEAPDTRSSDER